MHGVVPTGIRHVGYRWCNTSCTTTRGPGWRTKRSGMSKQEKRCLPSKHLLRRRSWSTSSLPLCLKKHGIYLPHIVFIEEWIDIYQIAWYVNQSVFYKSKVVMPWNFRMESTIQNWWWPIRRIIIHGLKPEYMGFITAVQGWLVQPSIEDLENLLSNQETLVK